MTRLALLVLGLLLAHSSSSAAQASADSLATIEGTVRYAENGRPMPFARVALDDRVESIIAGYDGVFRLKNVTAGKRVLLVRQIGFVPQRLELTIEPGTAPTPVTVSLARLPIRLDTVVVAARGCSGRGLTGNEGGADVQELFRQVDANAAQYREAAQQHPIEVAYERIKWLATSKGVIVQEVVDTIRHRMGENDPVYKPGSVVQPRELPDGRRTWSVVLPGFASMAASEFQEHHCFKYAGVDTASGARQYRVDFIPTADVKTPDVAGSLFLDASSLVLRSAVFRLVNLRTKEATFSGVEALVSFVEVVPFFVVHDGLNATQQIRNMRTTRGDPITEWRQIDRLMEHRFLNAVP
jgi:hypothetical protein